MKQAPKTTGRPARFGLSGYCPAAGWLWHHLLGDHQKETTQNRNIKEKQDGKNQPMPDVQPSHGCDLLPGLPIA
jgi:hypothetical protein